jgi:hypothetical protein
MTRQQIASVTALFAVWLIPAASVAQPPEARKDVPPRPAITGAVVLPVKCFTQIGVGGVGNPPPTLRAELTVRQKPDGFYEYVAGCEPSAAIATALTAVGTRVWTADEADAQIVWLNESVRAAVNAAVSNKALDKPLADALEERSKLSLAVEIAKLQKQLDELKNDIARLKKSSPSGKSSTPPR